MTSRPRSLISVCSPVVGSMTARLVLDSPEIQVKSVRIDSSASRSSAGRRWVRPPAGCDHRPIQDLEGAGHVHALAARHRARLHRAVAVALPKLGTATVRSIAAFNVTVRIIRGLLPAPSSRASCASFPRASCASPPVSAVEALLLGLPGCVVVVAEPLYTAFGGQQYPYKYHDPTQSNVGSDSGRSTASCR